MWPQALQLTRDECRGILRRLELESYSQVISVFRAQGGLSDAKAKLLEELRGIFHISIERHRAEARRVANDEQLATIADAISGPNTWQEWSREGRRPYPMLPRVAPQTALALLANNVADETAQENSKLPYPAETGDALKDEQLQLENQRTKEDATDRSNVITSDPFKIPEIPQNPKKNLKRNNEQQNSGANKKKSVGDNSAQQGQTQPVRKNYPHITANSPQANSATTSMNVSSDRKQKLNPADPYLEKQRFFHRQHQIAKQKLAKKAAAAASVANTQNSGGTPSKRQSTPAKSGRRANQKQLAMKQLQMEQQVPMQIDPTCVGGTIVTSGGQIASATQALLTQQQLDMQFVSYATLHQPPQQIFKEKDIEGHHTQMSALSSGAASTAAIVVPVSSASQYPPSLITPLSSPQVAASKRDISKNLNKLQLQQNQQQFSNAPNASSALPPSASIPSHDLQTSFGNILSSSSTSASSSSDKNKSSEKTLISTTPVQKYIVEERQPGMAFNLPASSNPSTLINIQSPHGNTSTQTQIMQVSNAGQQQQIMSFPQISAAATKLRAVNTTLIAPGGKMSSTRKITPGTLASTSATSIGGSGGTPMNAGALHELANVASTQSQVLHVAESGGSNNPLNAPLGTPLHTPPAVIQLHNTTGASTSSSADISGAAPHGKVVATKILPLVLAGPGNQNAANNSLINSSTLVMASSPTSSVNITSTTLTAGGSTIIKNLPSSMVLNTSNANLTPVTVTSTNNPTISNLGAGAAVFRKHPNIMKSSVAASSSAKPISSSAPHIISNVKLTPVSVAQTSSGAHLNTASTFKNVLPSTSGMVRTSVKICQSPNGKVFIQSAGPVDGSKIKLNTSSMQHKILSNTPTANSAAITSSGQRIAIQKVQIIPAPINNPAGGNPLQSSGNHINAKPGKSNMIFVPTPSTNVRPVTLSKMGNNLLLKSSANLQMAPTSPTTTMAAAAGDNSLAKSNIVVLSPTSSTLVKDQTNQNQLINEDTPLDILNMPIVMEPGVEVTSSSTGAETVTVLQSNIIDAANVSSSSSLTPSIILDQAQLHQPSKTVVLNVDWEMKLDIEQQNQYNNKNLKQQHRRALAHSSGTSSSPSSHQSTSCTSVHGPKQRRLNNDFITNSLNVTTTPTSTDNVIVLDDSFDDVIVEDHEDDQQQQQQQIDNDIPKILDMQIYQQHDGHDNRVAQMKATYNDDDVEIDVNDDDDSDVKKTKCKEILQSEESTSVNFDHAQQDFHRKEQQEQQFPPVESEIDAGFDETIVTEIDENTALEYIEEDGARKNLTIPATHTSATLMSKKTKVQQKTLAKSFPETPVKTTIVSNEEDVKPDNSTSRNDDLASAETISSSTTSHNDSSQIEQVEITSSNDATQETIANNSATQQVEP